MTAETQQSRSKSHVLRHLWMGGAATATSSDASEPLILERADGIYVYDSDGKEYIDAIASLEACAIGHGRREIADAIAKQYEKIEFLDTLRYVSPPTIELAERLAGLAPEGLDAVHFASSGSEAVEAAQKMARQYHYNRGHTLKTKLIARFGAYHGCTYGAMSIDGNYYRTRTHLYQPQLPVGRFVHEQATPHDIEALIIRERAETVSAVFIDPLATASGIYPQDDEFWVDLRAVCDRHDVLLVADEVITAFGRTGRWFASDRGGARADIMTVSKALSSGYFPISAVIASRDVAKEFESASELAFHHGHTFGGHPVAAAAALENLRIIEDEGLVERARSMGDTAAALLGALNEHPLVHEIRGEGLIHGVELRDISRPNEAPLALGKEVVAHLRTRGVLTFLLNPGNLLFLCPPLTISESEYQVMVSRIAGALDDVLDDRSGE